MAAGASTASPPVLTPGSNHFNYEVWEAGTEEATYQKMLFIPRIADKKRAYSQLHIRKQARIASVSLGQTAVGTGLTYQDPLGTEVTLTPAGNYVGLAWSANEAAQNEIPLDSEFSSAMEQALAESSDSSALANVATLTQFRGNALADFDAAMIRNALALLGRNTNGAFAAGDSTIYGITDYAQQPHLMSVPEFTNAEVRGDAENPNVKGVWAKGNGVMFMYTTVATEDGNGVHGCVWVPSAFAISWNVRSQTFKQDVELQKRLILFNNFGSTVQHDLRAVGLRTNNTIPA